MEYYLRSFYPVRFSDCDPFSHLNNARYIDYFMNAREDHLKTHYDMDLSSFYKKGIGWVIAQHEILYLRPANLNESVCIQTVLLDAGPDHLVLEAVMFDAALRQVKALMHTRLIPVSLSTGKKEPHSSEFMEFLTDKILPGINGNIPATQERVNYWQQQVKKTEKT